MPVIRLTVTNLINYSLTSSLIVIPFPHWSGQDSTSNDRFLYFQLIFRQGVFTTLMMEAVRTSETSVYIHESTQRYIPEL
jgi:hypothetical protein